MPHVRIKNDQAAISEAENLIIKSCNSITFFKENTHGLCPHIFPDLYLNTCKQGFFYEKNAEITKKAEKIELYHVSKRTKLRSALCESGNLS